MKSATAAAANAATATVLTQDQCLSPARSESDTTLEDSGVVEDAPVNEAAACDLKAESSATSARAGVSASLIFAARARRPAVKARSSARREAQTAHDSSCADASSRVR